MRCSESMARDRDEALGGHKSLGLDFDAGKKVSERFDVAVGRSITPTTDQVQPWPELTGCFLHWQTGIEDSDHLGRSLRGDLRQHVRWNRQALACQCQGGVTEVVDDLLRAVFERFQQDGKERGTPNRNQR